MWGLPGGQAGCGAAAVPLPCQKLLVVPPSCSRELPPEINPSTRGAKEAGEAIFSLSKF